MLDPLGQSQVLPYLRQLARAGVRFTLLSYERSGAFTPTGQERCRELRTRLSAENIEWHWLRYHRKPSLPATAYDVLAGVRYASRLVRRNGIEMVHARSHIPATIALTLKRRFGIKMIFDIRGLMAEEYRDAEHWQEGSVPYRLTKGMEKRALAAADGVVTLTQRIWPIISDWEGLRGRQVINEVVPCCADLDRFVFRSAERERRRNELGLDSRFTIVYSGSIDGWYLTAEMADFFAVVLRQEPDAYFLWLTLTRHDRIRALMEERRIDESHFGIRSVESGDVPSFLAAADAGLAFIKPCFSKLASSPTKYAEYLACGLPLIINEGIGDSDALVTEEKIGVLVRDLSDAGYAEAFGALSEFRSNPGATRQRAHEVANRLFNLATVAESRYTRLYERVLAN